MKLKPCPFCGSDTLNTGDTAPHVKMGVECAKCGAKHGSIESWNTRAIQEPTESQLRAGRSMADHLNVSAEGLSVEGWLYHVYKAMIKAQEEA